MNEPKSMEGSYRINMKVSVIVPVYNVEEYLDACLDSLVCQSLKDIEIILVNDGSTDASGEICEKYARLHSNVFVFHQENKGQSAARNLGVANASGEYILFVDSDDYIVLNACEMLYTYAKNNMADIVVGDILNEKEMVENDKTFRWLPCENKTVSADVFLKDAIKYGVYDIVPWIRLVKREYLSKYAIEFVEGCFYEDQEYTMKLLLNEQCVPSVLKVRFPFYYYRVDRNGSTTTHTTPKKAWDFLRILSMMDGEYSCYQNDDYRHLSESILSIAYYHFYAVCVKLNKKDFKSVMDVFLEKRKSFRCKIYKNAFFNEQLYSRFVLAHRCPHFYYFINNLYRSLKKR